MEPTNFDPKWYSHKFRGPGLRYEVGLCIRTGHIVWAYGGLPCGEWSDLKLARNVFIHRLLPNEKALADKGYRDQNFFENPNGDPHKKTILARHETVNARIKQFCCMKNTFRHALYLHPCFFHAVVNLIQLMLINGEPLFKENNVSQFSWISFFFIYMLLLSILPQLPEKYLTVK